MSLSYTGGPRFIRPSEVITRLKETRTILTLTETNFHIFGAGEFAKATESGNFIQNETAALYVMVGNTSSTVITDNGLGSNEVTHAIDILLYTRMKDIRSQTSDQLSVWFKEYLARSLVGYTAYEGAQPLMFGGDVFNTTQNVASYSRTYQFTQRVFIDGEDLIQDPAYGDLDDFLKVYQTATVEAPDFGDISDPSGLDIDLQP